MGTEDLKLGVESNLICKTTGSRFHLELTILSFEHNIVKRFDLLKSGKSKGTAELQNFYHIEYFLIKLMR